MLHGPHPILLECYPNGSIRWRASIDNPWIALSKTEVEALLNSHK